MKKQVIFFLLLISSIRILAQQASTNNNPSNPALSGTKAGDFWSRAGNLSTNGTNNIFGTAAGFNSGIFTQTNGFNRMRLNGTVSYLVTPGLGSQVRDGFLLLSSNPNAGLFTGATNGAFSLLHLNGDDGNIQIFGFRNWMRSGITFTENFDGAYIGIRRMFNAQTGGDDVSDFVINWNDNFGSFQGGAQPDNLVFCFTSNNGVSTPVNDLTGNSTNGRETMRHTSEGNIGIGPRFDNPNQPKSTVHVHRENDTSAWIQVTNQYLNTAAATQFAPTAINWSNGLRMGILGDPVKIKNGNAFIYNQELRHLIFSTNHFTPKPGQISNTNERMRITSFNAPTDLPIANTYGTYIPPLSPYTNTSDFTRVSISHRPAVPVTRPLSLLHLGYNAPGTTSGPTTNMDGWRNWMDIGTFTNSDVSASMYSGIKIDFVNGIDAVHSWGYTPFSGPNNGLSRMRFIFTTNMTSASPSLVSAGQNGIEAAHFWSDGNNTRMAVGDFQSLGFTPRNTLEILSSTSSPYYVATGNHNSSGLKFRNLNATNTPVANPGVGVLALDTGGNVIYVQGFGAGGGSGLGLCSTTPQTLTDLTGDARTGFAGRSQWQYKHRLRNVS